MSKPETSPCALQFEVPSGLPEGPWRACVKQPRDGWLVEAGTAPNKMVIATRLSERIARAIAAIPAMVEEIGRLREESDQFAEQAAARDQRDTDMQEIMGINNSLRALNAELIKAVQDMLYWADTPSQDVSPSWITGACHRARVILAKSESQSATPTRGLGLPAQTAPGSAQPAPGGIIETEKSNDAG